MFWIHVLMLLLWYGIDSEGYYNSKYCLYYPNFCQYYYNEYPTNFDYNWASQLQLKSPKSQKLDNNCRGDRPGTCHTNIWRCTRPIASDTSIFECDEDYQCPRYFKCCKNSCFKHKICQFATKAYHPTESARIKQTGYEITTASSTEGSAPPAQLKKDKEEEITEKTMTTETETIITAVTSTTTQSEPEDVKEDEEETSMTETSNIDIREKEETESSSTASSHSVTGSYNDENKTTTNTTELTTTSNNNEDDEYYEEEGDDYKEADEYADVGEEKTEKFYDYLP